MFPPPSVNECSSNKGMNQQQAESSVKQSKGWRQRLDVILQEMKDQIKTERQQGGPPREQGRHLALSVTHLEDSIMRQGMRMKALDEEVKGAAPNPYPESYDPESSKVEPTSDNLKL
jgi:hypothetical protein